MDIKVFTTLLEQNSIAYKMVRPGRFRIETLNGVYDCWPEVNRRKLVGLDRPCIDDLDLWLATLHPLPSGSYVFIVYHTNEDIEFYRIPEHEVEPYKDKLKSAQGYIVNVDIYNQTAEDFISCEFVGVLQPLWQCYKIPQTTLITSANISTVYNFGFYH